MKDKEKSFEKMTTQMTIGMSEVYQSYLDNVLACVQPEFESVLRDDFDFQYRLRDFKKSFNALEIEIQKLRLPPKLETPRYISPGR